MPFGRTPLTPAARRVSAAAAAPKPKPKSVSKTELIETLAASEELAKLSKTQVAAVVNATLDAITEHVVNGERVTLVGCAARAAGGIAIVTAYTDSQHVTANVLSPFVDIVPDSLNVVPLILAGQWTLTAPTSTVSGLRHLAGATVTGLADGNVIPPTVVSAAGTITLSTPASAIVVGLGFQAQFQDVPIDMGNPTVQAQRKKIAAMSVRLDRSRGVKVGTNQRDGSSLSPPQLSVPWNNMQVVPDSGPGAPNFPLAPYNALAVPLRTGDVRVATAGGTVTPGQVCVQQDNPLPCNIVALFPEVLSGDTPQMQASPKPQGKGR